jgi:hypothetical protein
VTGKPAIQVGLFFPVTFYAKSHFKFLAFESVRPCNISMAGFTLDFFFDVAFMVEHDMLRHIKHLFPRRGGPGLKIMMFFSDFRVVCNNIFVAKQAFFNRWNSRVGGPVHIGMTEPAVNLFVPCVKPVAEGDGLKGTGTHMGHDVKKIGKQGD